MISKRKQCSAVILAAGNSTRMGFPKSFLKWNENFFFLEKIINEYKEFQCSEIIIVVNKTLLDYYNERGLKFLQDVILVKNDYPELPRFVSVKLGIKEVTSVSCFLQNSDNPFTDQEILNRLFESGQKDGYSAPVFNGKSGHPILIGEDILKGILDIHDNSVILSEILRNYKRYSVDVNNENILCNINTPADYQKYFK